MYKLASILSLTLVIVLETVSVQAQQPAQQSLPKEPVSPPVYLCVYENLLYSHGAKICMQGSTYECRSGAPAIWIISSSSCQK
jgi:hypothetical protein